jgi:phosphoribosylaminoimidazole carboxylase/phosphoribosylaminoimidazole-succinocarboxamide synthase
VLLKAKDKITAFDATRKNDMSGKAVLSTATTSAIFELLNTCGIKTHFIKRADSDPEAFVGIRCEMIPLEVVTRRIATGSFLKRYSGVKEGYRFTPVKLEFFLKDDVQHDPFWTFEQCVEACFVISGKTIGKHELDFMGDTAVAVFEIIERAWATLDVALVDMKLEFGVNAKTGEVFLADVVDNDSWRIWPCGDKRLMRDKQFYRNLPEVTPEALEQVKKNYSWVATEIQKVTKHQPGHVVIFMGSPSDLDHCKKIQAALKTFNLSCDLRICSAHKGTEDALKILKVYEGQGEPLVIIAVAGRSNGLGPVLSGNSSFPVINCPPVSGQWGAEDVWSSMRLPSGLGCTTALNPDGAAAAAAQILGLHDHIVWGSLRAKRLNMATSLSEADASLKI